MKTPEQAEKEAALQTQRNEVFKKLTDTPMPESDRQVWITRLVQIDTEREAIEVAASVAPAPTAADVAEEARQTRIREIRATPGMLGQVNETGEKVLGYVEKERLQRELQALEMNLPVQAEPGTAA